MTRFQLIRTCILLVLTATATGIFCTWFFYPFMDAHRPASTPAMPLFMYILTWLVMFALAVVLIVVNIRSYIHPELDE